MPDSNNRIMKTYRYLYLLAAVAVLSACDKDNPAGTEPEPVADKVIIDPVVNVFTKSNPANDALQAVFNEGDMLGVACGEGTPVIYTKGEDDVWTPEEGKDLFWEESYDEPVTFNAYYPATDGVSFSTFILPADQSSEAKINSADYMTCTAEISEKPEDCILPLDLDRRTARVIINITGVEEKMGEVTAVDITSRYSAISPVNVEGPAKVVRAYKLAADRYAALVIPGSGVSGEVFVKVTTSKGGTVNISDIKDAVAGKSYTYDVYIGSRDATISDPAVSDWTGGTLDGSTFMTKTIALDRTGWSVTGKFDEREWSTPSNFKHLLDGDANTFWLSDWNGPNAIDQPVILVIDTRTRQSFSKVGFIHYHDPDPNKAEIEDNHNYTLEFYVSSDDRTWWNYDHDAFWSDKTSGGVERNNVNTSWKTDTNWEDQSGWEKVGAVSEMKSLHNPEVEYIDLDSSKSGRYFIIKCPEGGRGRREILEFTEIYLYRTEIQPID